MINESDFYTAQDIMKIFDVSQNTAYSWIHRKDIVKFKIGKQYYLPKNEFEIWLRRQRVTEAQNKINPFVNYT